MDKLVLRQSDIKTWKECGRRSWLGTFRNLTKNEVHPNTSHIGVAVHAGVAAHYQGVDPYPAIDAQMDIWHDSGFVIEEDIDEWAKTIAMAKLMVEGYIDWIQTEGVDHGQRFFIIEQRFEKLVGNFNGVDVFVTGAIDIGSEDDLGIKRMYDTKTKGDLKPDGLLVINDQLLTYDWLTDYTFDYGVHNMMKRSKRTARAAPPFYGRDEIRFTEATRAAFWVRMNGTIKNMVAAYQELEADPRQHFAVAGPNPTKDCSWKCPFYNACPMFDLGDDAEGYIEQNYREKEDFDG